MKQLLVGFLMLGLAVMSLQAAPTIISSGGGIGFNTGVQSGSAVPTGLLAGTPPSSGNTNYQVTTNIPVSSGWQSPVGTSQWITFLSSGDGTPTPLGQTACGTAPICNDQYVNFYQDFSLSGSGFSGTLQVMADDTAAVWVNGNPVFAANVPWATSGDYTTCSNSAIGCLNPSTVGTVNLASYLNSGANRIVFQVFQRNGDGFGLDYSASISNVPEPGFYGVLALGLSGLCLAFRRKRSA